MSLWTPGSPKRSLRTPKWSLEVSKITVLGIKSDPFDSPDSPPPEAIPPLLLGASRESLDSLDSLPRGSTAFASLCLPRFPSLPGHPRIPRSNTPFAFRSPSGLPKPPELPSWQNGASRSPKSQFSKPTVTHFSSQPLSSCPLTGGRRQGRSLKINSPHLLQGELGVLDQFPDSQNLKLQADHPSAAGPCPKCSKINDFSDLAK